MSFKVGNSIGQRVFVVYPEASVPDPEWMYKAVELKKTDTGHEYFEEAFCELYSLVDNMRTSAIRAEGYNDGFQDALKAAGISLDEFTATMRAKYDKEK